MMHKCIKETRKRAWECVRSQGEGFYLVVPAMRLTTEAEDLRKRAGPVLDHLPSVKINDWWCL